MAISLQRVIQSTSCLVLASRVGFSRTAAQTALFTVRINPRWWPPCTILEKFQVAISPQPVVRSTSCFLTGGGGGGSGTADIMTLFSIRTNSRWRPPPSWIFRMAISPQLLTIYLYSAVIFAIAQLSFLYTYTFNTKQLPAKSWLHFCWPTL